MAGNHGLEKGTEFSGTEVTASSKTLYGTSKLNLGSLEGQPVFLSTALPLQALFLDMETVIQPMHWHCQR